MNKKRFLITALVLVVLAGLVYLQVRAWKKFDWHRFWVATHNTNKFYLVAGVALVGRPGEFIRPYLISRKVNLSMASQLAVWTVERIFDMGAFALIMAVNILWSAERLRQLPGFAHAPTRMF